jgi:hypothetical protein
VHVFLLLQTVPEATMNLVKILTQVAGIDECISVPGYTTSRTQSTELRPEEKMLYDPKNCRDTKPFLRIKYRNKLQISNQIQEESVS